MADLLKAATALHGQAAANTAVTAAKVAAAANIPVTRAMAKAGNAGAGRNKAIGAKKCNSDSDSSSSSACG